MGYLASPAMWKRGAWVEKDRQRKRQLLSADQWQEGIEAHCAKLFEHADGRCGGGRHVGEFGTGDPGEHHCKLGAGDSAGRVNCSHGGVIPRPHWSCCGELVEGEGGGAGTRDAKVSRQLSTIRDLDIKLLLDLNETANDVAIAIAGGLRAQLCENGNDAWLAQLCEKDALVNVAWVNNAATRSLTDVAASCLALAAADRPSAADCEARLCAMYLERSSFLPPISTLLTTYHDDDAQLHTELSFAKKTALEASRGGKTDRDIREARFWSYLFGTPRARERACELWEALPESDREESSRVLEYVKILARCRGPRERTARTIALLERHAVAVDGLEGGEVAAFIFVCGEGGDDNVAVVQGYMDVLVEQHKAGGGEWVLSVAAPIMLAALDDDAAEWVCPECTVLNAPSLLACNMCGSERSDDVLAVAVAGGGGCGGGGDKVGVGGAADQSERTCILCNTVNQNENNLNTWLDSINLSHVYYSLIELGATDKVKDLVDLDKEDIDELGLKKLEKKRLWRAVEKIKSSALGNEDDEDDEVRSDWRMVGGLAQVGG